MISTIAVYSKGFVDDGVAQWCVSGFLSRKSRVRVPASSSRDIFCDCVRTFSWYVVAIDVSHCVHGVLSSIPVSEYVQRSENPDYWPVVARVTSYGVIRAGLALPLRAWDTTYRTSVGLQRNKFYSIIIIIINRDR